jgi:hypothetical protein
MFKTRLTYPFYYIFEKIKYFFKGNIFIMNVYSEHRIYSLKFVPLAAANCRVVPESLFLCSLKSF